MGGPARHVVGLHAGLAEQGYACTLFAGELGPGEGDMRYLAESAGVPVETVPGLRPEPSPANDLRCLWWLYRRFRRDRPHIVHTHTAKAGALGRIAAVMARVPVCIHTYHGHVLGGSYFGPLRTTVFTWVERALGRVSSRLVIISPQQLGELADVHRVADAPSFDLIPLGLDLHPFRSVDRGAVGAETRAALGLTPDAWVVGTIGRLVPVKNHTLLLEAFARAARDRGPANTEACLLIVGDGEDGYRRDLQRAAKQLGIADQVRWLGWRDDLPELLSAMDVFALTSNDEGTPVAVIEALTAGTPVVARSVGGVPDVAAHVAGTELVATSDPRDFAAGLIRIRPPELDHGARDRERDALVRHFSEKRLTADVAALYRKMLSQKGLPATA